MRNLVQLETWRVKGISKESTPKKEEEGAFNVTDVYVHSCEKVDYVIWEHGEVQCIPWKVEGGNTREDGGIEPLWRMSLKDIDGDTHFRTTAKWFKIAYIQEMEAVMCVSREGHIVLIHLDALIARVVGRLEDGIKQMEWSLTEEMAVVVSGSAQVIVMNTSWETIAHSSIMGLNKFKDDDEVQIAWRSDSTLFAVNMNSTDSGVRKVVIFNTDLTEQVVGRTEDRQIVSQVGAAIAWSPNCALTATSQPVKEHTNIIFFESNGLRHRDFKLVNVVPRESTVSFLQWNLEADILAVLIQETHLNVSRLQLYSRCNYHWYLKQELRYTHPVAACQWDPEDAYTMHVVLNNGDLFVYYFIWDTVVSLGISATVAVIDGCKLNMTPLASGLLPPPMYANTITFEYPINNVAFGYNSTTSVERAVVALSNGAIHSFLLQHTSTELVVDSPSRMVHDSKCNIWNNIRQLACIQSEVNEEFFILVASDDRLDSLAITKDCAFATVSQLTIDGHVLRVGVTPFDCFVALTNGLVLRYGGVKDESASLEFIGQLPRRCTSVMLLHDTRCKTRYNILGLSGSTLYFNEEIVEKACGSFTISYTHNFVVLTTLGQASRIKFISMEDIERANAPLTSSQDRSIERGARLVAVIPHTPDLVLQMPRGNLEGISPRPLVLSTLQDLMEQTNFGDAIELCRRHRIDTNILFDYNPNRFVSNIACFINQIKPHIRVDRLNLFLTALHSMNVCETKYKVQRRCNTSPVDVADLSLSSGINASSDKINLICTVFVKELQNLNGNGSLIRPILTCFVKQDPPALGDALNAIATCRQTMGAKEAEKALEYLTFLVDIHVLFNEALGLYDFDLVRLVASKSQLDPREYTELLRSFEEVQSPMREYRVDMFLRRYSKALRHLSHAGDLYSSEVLSLIKEHQLFEEALSLFGSKQCPRLHHDILDSYAWHLSTQEQYHNAGMVYLSISKISQAIEAFRKSFEWEMVFSLTHRTSPPMSPEEIRRLAYSIASDFRQRGGCVDRSKEMARILMEYCDDIDEAVTILIQGQHWQEAIRVAILRNRRDLIVSNIKEAVEEMADTTMEQMVAKLEAFETSMTKLNNVRTSKRMFREHGIGLSTHAGEEDTQSMASGLSSACSALSTDSQSSVGSHNSARSIGDFSLAALTESSGSHFYASDALQKMSASLAKPKLPRRQRKNRIRQGTPEEEQYHLQILSESIPTVRMGEEISALMQALLYFEKNDIAERVLVGFSTLLDSVKKMRLVDSTDPTQSKLEQSMRRALDCVHMDEIKLEKSIP